METCEVCGNPIKVQIFKNSGHCSDDCRKIKQGEITNTDQIVRILSAKSSQPTPWERNRHRSIGMR